MPSTSPSVPHGGLSYRSDGLRNGDPRQRLIVALDVSTAAAAQKIVAQSRWRMDARAWSHRPAKPLLSALNWETRSPS